MPAASEVTGASCLFEADIQLKGFPHRYAIGAGLYVFSVLRRLKTRPLARRETERGGVTEAMAPLSLALSPANGGEGMHKVAGGAKHIRRVTLPLRCPVILNSRS